MIKKDFTIVIEKEEDGGLIASVVELPGCHTQAETHEELFANIREAIELYLEVEKPKIVTQFVGLQRISL